MRIVVKIGSNVLTRADGTMDVTRMSALVDQVAALRREGHQIIIVSSGAVASGKSIIPCEHPLDKAEQRQLFSAVGQVLLMSHYSTFFRDYGINVGQVLTVKENFSTPYERENVSHCMEAMLENGVLPIVNENDTVCLTELMFTDNDELSGLVAQLMQADKLIILSNIDGLYDGDPSLVGTKLIPRVRVGEDLSSYISVTKSSAGRGGMQSKCHTALEIAACGIDVLIANGKRENILIDLFGRDADVPHTEFTR